MMTRVSAARAWLASEVSGKRRLSGQARNVRKLWTANGKSDNMIAGRENGHVPVAYVGYTRVSTLDQ